MLPEKKKRLVEMSHDKLSFINQSQALSSGLVNPGYPSCCTIRKKKKKVSEGDYSTAIVSNLLL